MSFKFKFSLLSTVQFGLVCTLPRSSAAAASFVQEAAAFQSFSSVQTTLLTHARSTSSYRVVHSMATLTSMMPRTAFVDTTARCQPQHFRAGSGEYSVSFGLPSPARLNCDLQGGVRGAGTPRTSLFSPATVDHCAQLAERSGISATPGTVNLFAVSDVRLIALCSVNDFLLNLQQLSANCNPTLRLQL